MTYLNNSFSVNPDIIATTANAKIPSPNDEWIFKYCARKLSPARESRRIKIQVLAKIGKDIRNE